MHMKRPSLGKAGGGEGSGGRYMTTSRPYSNPWLSGQTDIAFTSPVCVCVGYIYDTPPLPCLAG